MHILYVEDHKEQAKVLKALLETHGHLVDVVYTAREAKELCTQIVFDLWILDIVLPDCHGGDLLRALRKMCDTPALAVTGLCKVLHVEEAADDGFDAYLVKPVEVDTILDAIAQVNVTQLH